MGRDLRTMLGDCLDRIAEIADASVDAIICDPPYPMIRRPYGMMTEAEWHAMMRGVVAESRRVLKPSGSAVFILQPNSERVGRMRPWLWEFMAWTAREWNMVQDAYWFNFTAIPTGGACRGGLLRSSIKPCVWLGPTDCYRDQAAVLWSESEGNALERKMQRASRHANGHHRVSMVDNGRMGAAAAARGGVTPFNLIPVQGGDRWSGGGIYGHTAATPPDLCDWWVRYLTPANGIVCDPFMGSGTVGLAALKRGRKFIGIERDETYFKVAQARIAEHRSSMPLLEGVS